MYPSTLRGRCVTVLTLVAALLLLGCSDIVGIGDAPSELRAERRSLYAISISPGNHTGLVGDTLQYVAVVTDQFGRVQPASTIEWRSSDSRVARVGSTGWLIALAPGTTTVTVVTYGKVQNASLTVRARDDTPGPGDGQPGEPLAAGAEPVFNPSLHQSLWSDDFEAATSSASIYSRYATQSGETGIQLDATGGRIGSKGMRIQWLPRTGCNDDSHFVEGSFAPQQEVVVQYSVRYQANFAFDWIGRGGACSGNAKKLFFLWAAAGSRFDFISENHVLGVGSDYDHPLFAQNMGQAVTPEALGDGQWHRVTLRVRQSSTPTATDGYVHGWVDGVQKWAVNNIASHASGGWVLFKLPTTFNQGSPVQQVEWMDDFRIWRP